MIQALISKDRATRHRTEMHDNSVDYGSTAGAGDGSCRSVSAPRQELPSESRKTGLRDCLDWMRPILKAGIRNVAEIRLDPVREPQDHLIAKVDAAIASNDRHNVQQPGS
jgi:hypothetical protein